MAFPRSAVMVGGRAKSLVSAANHPILALSLRQISTSSSRQNTGTQSKSTTTSFTRSNTGTVPATSSTSTTAQSSGTRTGYNALAKAEQKVAKQQKGMARQMPGMSLENQDQMLAGELFILVPLGLGKVQTGFQDSHAPGSG